MQVELDLLGRQFGEGTLPTMFAIINECIYVSRGGCRLIVRWTHHRIKIEEVLGGETKQYEAIFLLVKLIRR